MRLQLLGRDAVDVAPPKPRLVMCKQCHVVAAGIVQGSCELHNSSAGAVHVHTGDARGVACYGSSPTNQRARCASRRSKR